MSVVIPSEAVLFRNRRNTGLILPGRQDLLSSSQNAAAGHTGTTSSSASSPAASSPAAAEAVLPALAAHGQFVPEAVPKVV